MSAADELAQQLARDVLLLAAHGGMPDSYWLTDRRIARASRVLRLTPEQARDWAQHKAARRAQP